ncbi:ABC transporter substrate-binding protein [Euhalothece natronophila Z-M001]|uniref:ABC transporter substrate-binding protein n=1 Tax=Euhalothece natronophila Z-M001 TaxID=522448 RepID=A0A5B8NPJ3_9CHRO|nr:ABC transporter substrate-binding protein [Euhalothece natronophila]QDZ40065.1 ABC transporter substrate-binding protein [Euhalothece natronophila Z-M001]
MTNKRFYYNLGLGRTSRRKFLQYSSLAVGTGMLAACNGFNGGGEGTGPLDDDFGENPIPVGVLYSTTGEIAIVEKSLQEATFLAIDQINSGTGPWEGNGEGINGRKIQPVVVNPDSDWDLYNQMARRLINDDEVKCVLGCYTSASRLAVLPVFEGEDSILYYPVYYEGNECSSNVFYTGAAPNQQVTDSIPYCYENFGPRAFFVGSDYVYPRESNRIAIAELEELGGESVGEEYAELGTTEFSTIINRIQQAQPDFVLSNIVGDSIPAFYRQYRDAGITPDQIPIMAYPTTEEEIQAMGAEFAEGHYTSFNYFQSVESPENEIFVQEFKEMFGDNRVTNGVMEAAYIQTFFMAQAMKDILEAGDEITTETLREATRGQEFQAPQGKVKVDEDNYHAYLYARIARWNSEGQADIQFSSPAAIKPIPWSQALYPGRMCQHPQPDDRSGGIVETDEELETTYLDV